jgi:hypothetical protein
MGISIEQSASFRNLSGTFFGTLWSGPKNGVDFRRLQKTVEIPVRNARCHEAVAAVLLC